MNLNHHDRHRERDINRGKRLTYYASSAIEIEPKFNIAIQIILRVARVRESHYRIVSFLFFVLTEKLHHAG